MKKYPAKLLAEIKKNLEEEKEKLAKRLKALSLEDPFANPDRVNDNAASDTEAKEEIDHERIEALQNDIKKNILSLEEALQRIEKGKYGFCEKCGEMIDTDRLAAYPTAKYCIACQNKTGAK